jgi:hypothetical protein
MDFIGGRYLTRTNPLSRNSMDLGNDVIPNFKTQPVDVFIMETSDSTSIHSNDEVAENLVEKLFYPRLEQGRSLLSWGCARQKHQVSIFIYSSYQARFRSRDKKTGDLASMHR